MAKYKIKSFNNKKEGKRNIVFKREEKDSIKLSGIKRNFGNSVRRTVKKKRRSDKLDSKSVKEGTDSEEESRAELREPTAEELVESEKPENILNIVTVRGRKKDIHKKSKEVRKGRSLQKEIEKNVEYLEKWKHNREEWRFEKLRQISIQQSIFEEDKITDKIWPIALEYLGGSKGSAKALVIQLAEKEIRKIDEEIEQTGTNDLINHRNYRRARELLQFLQ